MDSNIFGLIPKRQEEEFDNEVSKIKKIEETLEGITDSELLKKSDELKIYLKDITNGTNQSEKNPNLTTLSLDDALNEILPDAYALAKKAVEKVKGFKLHDVQLHGGIALKDGQVAEMATGEGKTLTAVLPSYLHALAGEKVHVYVPNQTLARRDFEETKPIYELLGLTSGVLLNPGDEVSDGKSSRELSDSESEEIKRDAYKCDITYGEVSTFVFDYERDCMKIEADKRLYPDNNRYFALVDEVDSILLDRARTPLIISGTSEAKDNFYGKEEMHRKRLEEDDYQEKHAAYADGAVSRIFALQEQFKDKERKGRPVRFAKDRESFEAMTDNKTELGKECLENSLLIVNREPKSNDYTITELGMNFISKYYIGKNVDEIFSVKYHSLDDNIKKKYVVGRDFTIQKRVYQGEELPVLRLTDQGYIKILRSGDIPEINKLENDFMNYEYQAFEVPFVDRAIKAYFCLDRDRDYVLSDVVDEKTGKYIPNQKQVSLLNDGRIAKGSVFADGQHRAVEMKEEKLARNNNKSYTLYKTLFSKEAMSLTMPTYMQLYQKVSGMTGTSSTLLRDIYGLDTVEIEKNSEYAARLANREILDVYDKNGSAKFGNRLDHPEELYQSEEEKIERIFEEIQKSQNKGQPVLISTTSVSESIRLQRILESRLNTKVQVLNAQTKQENYIISRAGEMGKITISTEMAGRGTDIKLGFNPDVLLDDFKNNRNLPLLKEWHDKKFTMLKSDNKLLLDSVKGQIVDELDREVISQDLSQFLINRLEKAILAGRYPNLVRDWYNQGIEHLKEKFPGVNDEAIRKALDDNLKTNFDKVANKVARDNFMAVAKAVKNDESNRVVEQLVIDKINSQDRITLIEDYLKYQRENHLDKISKEISSYYHDVVNGLGGLKIIGSGHFTSNRVDRQVRGRSARQGDNGETIFISTVEDLKRIGVSKSDSQKLIAAGKNIGEDVYDLISNAQDVYDGILHTTIVEENKLVVVRETLRRKYQKELDLIRLGDRYEQAMEYMILQVSKRMVGELSNKEKYNSRTRLSRMNISKHSVVKAIEENFGVKIDPRGLNDVRRAGSLVNFISNVALDKFHQELEVPGKKEELKNLINVRMDEGWDTFLEKYDSEKKQLTFDRMANLPGSQDESRFDASVMADYGKVFSDVRTNIVSNYLVGKDYIAFKSEHNQKKDNEQQDYDIDKYEKEIETFKDSREVRATTDKYSYLKAIKNLKVGYENFVKEANENRKISDKKLGVMGKIEDIEDQVNKKK